MIAIGIEYLTGGCRAEERHRRDRAEWPPHPDRFFMALVATMHDAEGASDPREREAIRWISGQPPPSIAVDLRASRRVVVTSFVPTNDDRITTKLGGFSGVSTARVQSQMRVLGDHRGRKPRTFPVVVPDDPRVFFMWSADPSDAVIGGLRSLLSRLSRIGHSASLVRGWIESAPPMPSLVPDDLDGQWRLRVPTSGRLEMLEEHHARGEGPAPASRRVGYRVAEQRVAEQPASELGRLIMLRRVGGSEVDVGDSLLVCDLLRKTILRRCPKQPPPEWITGHASDGGPSRREHLAVIPLVDPRGEVAPGSLVGIAVITPPTVSLAERRRLLDPCLLGDEPGDPLTVWGGEGGWFEWRLRPVTAADPAPGLGRDGVTGGPGGARRWSTVTPVVLDRHPRRTSQVADAVSGSLEQLGLPRPRRVLVGENSFIHGLPASSRMPRMRRRDGSFRCQWHCHVEFDQPVAGPLIVGAGRFVGYGLMRPADDLDSDDVLFHAGRVEQSTGRDAGGDDGRSS